MRGIAALSVMAQYWEGSLPDDDETNNAVATGRSTIATAFTDLLQVAWLTSAQNVGLNIFINSWQNELFGRD